MKKIFSILAMALVAMTASAKLSGYELTVGTNDHGTVKFYVNEVETTYADEGQTVTVKITPDTGWSMGGIQGLWYASGEATKAPKRKAAQTNADLLKDFELEPVTGQQNTYTFEMKRANAEISVNYRKLLTHTDINISSISAVTYSGQALTPTVTVKDGETNLTKDTHFSVSYENNVNAGTGKATIIGKGLYDGQVVRTFTINKADINPTAPTALENLTYNTQAQTLISAGQAEGGEMQYSLDGTTYAKELPQGTNAGSYTVFYKVVADANHNDVAPAFINVAIYKAALSNVLLQAQNLVYNQQEQSPVITSVKAGELTVPAEAYTVSGNKATNVGNYEVVIEPKDDAQNYDGRATTLWSIVAADAQTFSIELSNASLVYDGNAKTPTVTVKDGETVLVENTDYTVSYANNVNVGTATITATGLGNYTGTQTKEFSITQADMTISAPTAISGLVYTTQPQALANAGTVKGGEMFYSLDNQTWSKTIPTGIDAKEYTIYYKIEADANHKAVDPSSFKVTIGKADLTSMSLAETNFIYNQLEREAQVVYVNAGTIVVPAESYEVTDNKATTVGNYTAKVKGKGNFKGEVTTAWSIVPANAQLFELTLGTTEYTYDGNAKTPTVTVKDGEAVLVENTDYTLAYTGNVDAGTATVTATAKGNYTGTQTATFTIIPATLTNVLLQEQSLVYNQQELSPVITDVKAGNLDVPATAYTVSGNKATTVGNYTAEVKGKGNFKGEVTTEWSIVPANAQTFSIELSNASLVYDGNAKTPTVTVKDGETVLVENTDYTVSYANNVNVGTATITATGLGNYTGTQTKEFSITQADMTISAPTAISGLVYTTQPQALANAGTVKGGEMFYSLDNQTWSKTIPTGIDAKEYTIYYKIEADANHKAVDPSSFKVTIGKADLTSMSLAETNFIYNQLEREAQVVYVNAGTIVVPAESYEVTDNKATTVGNYTAKVKGKGNFKGEVTTAWSIVPANAQLFELTLGTTEYTYDGNAKTPTVTVKDGEAVLVENTDYTLAYTGNVDAGTATVTATAKGNYTGTQTATFTIIPATLTRVTLAQTEFQYDMDKNVTQVAGIAEVKAGNLTVPAAQYDVEGNTATDPGTYTVTVTGKTNFQGSVTADFIIKDQVVDGTAEETETGEEVEDVKLTLSVVDRETKTLSIDNFEADASDGEGITIEIPAQINGWDVVAIGPDAMANLDNVTDIIMPDTEEPIQIEEGAFPGTATIHTTLALLDDYALMASLQQNYENTKVVCTVTPANKYWTLGTGCDVVIPEGIDVYTVQVKNTAEVATEIIPEDMLKYDNERIIKANNGVLLLGEAGKTYDLWAYSGRIASGTPVAKSDNKDYGQKNCLEPVIEKKHYDSGHYFVLQNNTFHSILAEGDEVKVPAGKAVLHLGNEQAGAKSRVLRIVNGNAEEGTTGLETIENEEPTIDNWYDLSGRKLNGMPKTKGIFIKNGKKVMR